MADQLIDEKETFDSALAFLYLINSVRDARHGNDELAGLFARLGQDVQKDGVMTIFDNLMGMRPLTVEQAKILSRILVIGGQND